MFNSVSNDVPIVVCSGNHDYSWNDERKITDRSSTKINDYCKFAKTVGMVVESYEDGIVDNVLVK